MKNNNDVANDLTDEMALQEHNNNKYYTLAYIYIYIDTQTYTHMLYLSNSQNYMFIDPKQSINHVAT